MPEPKALIVAFDNSDKRFFQSYPDRLAHIRLPYRGEAEGEFWQLGEHNRARRRILLCRADAEGKPLPKGQIMKIPFLLYSDETVEDTDEVLLPIVSEIMQSQLR
jgi:hypothetical protein